MILGVAIGHVQAHAPPRDARANVVAAAISGGLAPGLRTNEAI